MNIPVHAFETIDWAGRTMLVIKGETGTAYSSEIRLGDIRVRRVEYSPGYKADHWCKKGHVIFCHKGQMQTELEDGRIFTLEQGMTYLVGDNCEAHRSSTAEGCTLFIVD